jgi:Sulfotransferase family
MGNSIFAGGWGGSGSRLLQMILERAGLYVGDPEENINIFYDLVGKNNSILKGFINWHQGRLSDANYKKLFEPITDQHPWYSLKMGHFMYMIPTLKKWYPESKFILTVRHPIDSVFNERRNPASRYYPWSDLGNLSRDISLEERLSYYEKVTNEALKHTDFIFRLEDFCLKPAASIKKLFAFVGIDDEADKYLNLIKIPASLGARGDITSDNEIIKTLGY